MTGDQNMDQQQSDLSSLLEYSKALNQSASSLLKAAQSFERTANKFLVGFDKSSQNLTDSLGRQAKAYDDKQKKNREERERQEKEYSKDLADELELDNRRRHAENTRMQRYSTLFVSSLKTVGSFFIKSFTSAYTRVSNAYEQNLERITTSLQITNREYTTQLNNITRQIWGQGLAKQFSQIDWQKSMGDTLSTGLRGEAATNMAYRNMIANKLLPAIQTNTRAYIQMSKRFGEDFEKNMLAFGKHVEKIYGAEGLEQGKIDQMLNTLQAQIRYTAAQQGLSTEDTNKMINRLTASISFLESRNIDSDEFIQNLYESATTTPGGLSNIMSYVNGIGTPGQAGRTLTSGLDQYLAKYLNSYLVYGGSVNAMVARTSALGGNVQNAYAINAALGFGQVDLKDTLADVSKMVDDFESGKVYNGLIDQLTSGRYSSATTQYEKWMENQTAIIANELTNALPHNTQVLASVWQIIKAWFTAWQAGQVGGILNRTGGQNGNFLTNFLNRPTTTNVLKEGVTVGRNGQYYMAGHRGAISAADAFTTQGTGFGGASTVGGGIANFAAGPLALAAGLIWGGVDAARGGIAAENAGYGVGGIAANALRGFFTGGTADTEQAKNDKIAAALRGERVKFSWSDLAKNAGKGALIGTGIGTAAGGWAAGTGTVVGAVAGGIVGAAASAVDQLVENAKYNKLADATNSLNESLNNLNKATTDYLKTLNKEKDLKAAINVTQDKTKKGTKEYNDSLQKILNYYPDYTNSIKEAGGVSSELAEALSRQLEYETLISQNDLWVAAEETKKDRSKYVNAADAFTDVRKQSAAYSLAGKLKAYEDDFSQLSEDEMDDLVRTTAQEYGVSETDLAVSFNKIVGKGGLTTYSDATGRHYGTLKNTKVSSAFDKATQLESGEWVSGTGSEVTTSVGNYLHNTLYPAYKAAYAEYTSYKALGEQWDSLSDLDRNNLVTNILSLVSDYHNDASDYRRYGGTDLFNEGMPFDFIKNNPNALKAFGGEVPRFKVGSYNIGEDNTPALLHAGEMVLTSSDANVLRELASGQGIRGLLSGLLSISRATAVAADDSTTAANPIIEAIQLQTRTLSEHLINILGEVREISRIQRNRSTESSGVSRDLRTYQGV